MIFLTGFMGSGKTTVGQDLARRAGRPFADLDDLVSQKAGSTIPEIFRCAGERAFRVLEREALVELVGEADPACIVATGGGLPVDPVNRGLMKACGSIVYLRAPFEALEHRVEQDGSRPMWTGDARDLLEARRPFYEDADLKVSIGGKGAGEISREILDSLPGLPDPVGVVLQENPYPIHIGRGIFRDILHLIERQISPEGIFALVDENVLRHHGQAVRQALQGVPAHVMPVPSGEGSKSMPFLSEVLNAMFSRRVNRQWLCLAVGGGVTGDLAGFAASVYMRGIPVVQAATTLLAQVDSGIGGKTAINHDQGKNLIGTFHQPLAVISDVDLLDTLDREQVTGAMAEVVKYGVIMDAPLFEYLEAGPPFDYERIVRMCARDKARVVARDEREGGVRRTLNFGHTLGHAVEKSTGYTLGHGRAVALGMAFAARLSHRMGMLPPEDLGRIMGLMSRLELLPVGIDLPRAEEVAEALQVDKKGAQGGVHFVLTPFIGGVSVRKLSEIEVLEAYHGFAVEYSKGL